MITKQEYTELKKRRAEIALILRQRKKSINIDQHFLSKGNTSLNITIGNLYNSIQIFKQELKWLDILLRDTKEQLRNRYESKRLEELFLKKLTKHIIPEEFKLEYEVSKTPKTED